LPCFSLLSSETILHITGPDTQTFLQGQTTCDVRLVNENQAAIGAYCTPQGRVVCDFVLAQLGEEHFGLRMRREIREHAAQVLGKFIVFSKAELDAGRDDWLVVAAWGDGVKEALESVFGSHPGGQWGTLCEPGYTLVQTDQESRQFEIYIAADHEKLAELQHISTWEDESLWQREQALAGIARIEAATIDTLVPQVLNYDLTGHISFTKGCYTGQEVIARLHYLGKSKRRTYLAHLPEAVQAGDPIFKAGNKQSVGNVINCVAGEENLALVAATEDASKGSLNLHSPEGPTIHLQDPPYSLDQDD
jgi:folate-binding protein YgfZ